MNVHELKATDPVLFDKEYWAWVALQGADCGWWEHIEEDFKETMQLLGVEVDKVYFNLGYGQSDYASFTGYIDFGKWLEIAGYAEQYPVLTLAASDYGRLNINDRYDSPRVDMDYCAGNTFPSGVFVDLPYEIWEELEHAQLEDEDWEKLINEWLRDKARELYEMLRAEYEYQTSDEQFIAYCEANEVQFNTED